MSDQLAVPDDSNFPTLRATNWKYAFGEALLIVVGISIALAIDQWREDYESKRIEREYMDQLIQDLKSTEDFGGLGR